MKIIYLEATINYISQVNYPIVSEIVSNGIVKEIKNGLKYILIEE